MPSGAFVRALTERLAKVRPCRSRLPSVLIRFAEDGRKTDIPIFCAEGLAQQILAMIEIGYAALLPKLRFSTNFVEVKQGEAFPFRNAKLQFAQSIHPVKNFAISVEADGRKYCYSGDGNFNDRTAALYEDADLLAQPLHNLIHTWQFLARNRPRAIGGECNLVGIKIGDEVHDGRDR